MNISSYLKHVGVFLSLFILAGGIVMTASGSFVGPLFIGLGIGSIWVDLNYRATDSLIETQKKLLASIEELNDQGFHFHRGKAYRLIKDEQASQLLEWARVKVKADDE